MYELIIRLPLFSIILSFIGAVLCSLFKKKISFAISMIVCFIVFGFSLLTLGYCVKENTYIIYTMGHYGPDEQTGFRLCNEIRFGILESLLASFFSLLLILCVFGGYKRLQEDVKESKISYFFTLICLILVSCISLIYTNDIFTGFVFLEISTLSSCGILMIKEKGYTTLATIRYMIFNLVGSGLFLIGISMLYDLTGFLSIEDIYVALHAEQFSITPVVLVTFVLITIGLSVKSGLFPFHFWMPDAYGVATPSASSILSGIVSKGYILLLIKVIYRMIGIDLLLPTNLLHIFFILGVLGMVIGSFNAIRQTSINRMIAFSSAAQIGYIFMGIGLGYQSAMIASIFHIMTHAITKPLLFISARKLSETCDGSLKFRHLRGSGRIDKLSGIAFTCGALSMVGIPLFAGFTSKYLFALSALEGSKAQLIIAYVALIISTVLNAIYFVRTVITIYLPLSKQNTYQKVRYHSFYLVSVIGLLILNIGLGLGNDFIVGLIKNGLAMF